MAPVFGSRGEAHRADDYGDTSGPEDLDIPHEANTPLFSKRAHEVAFQVVLRAYLEGMPEHVRALRAAGDANDRNRLRETAHRLRGSGGSHGFRAISDAAERLEAAVSAGERGRELKEHIDVLVTLLRRARAGLKRLP